MLSAGSTVPQLEKDAPNIGELGRISVLRIINEEIKCFTAFAIFKSGFHP
jgi:hypothetical protein